VAPATGLAPLTNLERLWFFDPAAQLVAPSFGWGFYDPRPELAAVNTVTALTSEKIYWIKVGSDQTVTLNGKSRNLFKGWNPVTW
jgi:hypothetical protein